MTEAEYITKFKSEGYNPVYTWIAEPKEEDPGHMHDFDTKLVILEGEIKITLDGVDKILKPFDIIEIPKNTIHAGLVGAAGCKYVVAEKH